MDDLISRAAAIDAIVSATAFEDADYIKKLCENPANAEDWLGGICDAINAVEDVSSILDVESERCGHWITIVSEHYGDKWQADACCPFCDFTKYSIWSGYFPEVNKLTAKGITIHYSEKVKLPNYCENCGARLYRLEVKK